MQPGLAQTRHLINQHQGDLEGDADFDDADFEDIGDEDMEESVPEANQFLSRAF